MSSPPSKTRTLDEVISSLPIEDQARVVARASDLVTEVLQPPDQGSSQPSHDEESPLMSESMSPIDRITIQDDSLQPSPHNTEVELRPITVLLGGSNSGKSSFMGLLTNLRFNSLRPQSGPYKRRADKDAVSVEFLDVHCDGQWTQIVRYVSVQDETHVLVIGDGDSDRLAVPDAYPHLQLPEPLRASVESIIDVDKMALLELQHAWESWGVSGDVRADAVTEDLRRLGLVKEVRFGPIPGGVKDRHPFLTMPSGEEAHFSKCGGSTRDVIHVLIALRSAVEGQLVLIHNPEAGLHPRAVIALTGLLVEAARRGVRLIVETQSTTIVRALQLAVAEDDSGWVRDNLALYWFDRTGGGAPKVTMADVQADGSFGEWPYDLSTVELDLTRSLLVASHRCRAALQALAKVGL